MVWKGQKNLKNTFKMQKNANACLILCVLPRQYAFFYQNINFLTVFTMFFEGRKTAVKHDVFEGRGAPVGTPRFLAISTGKKHSPPLSCAGGKVGWWVVAGLVGWLVWLVGWLAGWLAGWLVMVG